MKTQLTAADLRRLSDLAHAHASRCEQLAVEASVADEQAVHLDNARQYRALAQKAAHDAAVQSRLALLWR